MTQPVHVGFFRAVVADGEIVHSAWLHRRAQGEFVGVCRKCHDLLIPERPDDHGGRTDYEATCRNPECASTVMAPGGRVLRQSAAKSLQPKGTNA